MAQDYPTAPGKGDPKEHRVFKHTVKTQFGTFTRSSQNRRYSFLIVACGEPEARIKANFADEKKRAEKELAGYIPMRARAAAGETSYDEVVYGGHIAKRTIWPVEQWDKWIADLQERIATSADRLDAALIENVRIVSQKRGHVIGWSASAKNAYKTAQTAAKWHATVTVVPVMENEVVETQPRKKAVA